jgi:hypothetical protein
VTRPAAPPTLTDEQIGDLRRDVEAGKRRRVVLLTDSAGLPAGGMGDVIRVGWPDTDGSDFIGVRIGGDDLFFAPSELGLGGRRSAAKAATAKAPAKAGPGKSGPPEAGTEDDAAAASASAKATGSKVGAAKVAAAKARPAPAGNGSAAGAPAGNAPATGGSAAAGATAAKTSPHKASPAAKAAKAPAKTARGRKPPKLPAVAITIRSTEAGWTVEALRGGKATLKATPVRAGTVQEIADALDESVVTGMVREVLDARRAVAESEASELREALARAEAVLAEYEAGH